jgi:hypothetical protein
MFLYNGDYGGRASAACLTSAVGSNLFMPFLNSEL